MKKLLLATLYLLFTNANAINLSGRDIIFSYREGVGKEEAAYRSGFIAGIYDLSHALKQICPPYDVKHEEIMNLIKKSEPFILHKTEFDASATIFSILEATYPCENKNENKKK